MKLNRSLKILTILAALAAVAVAAFFFFFSKEKIKNMNNEKSNFIGMPHIVCCGDSLTEGIGGNGVNYPDVLNSKIQKYIAERIEASDLEENEKQLLLDEIFEYEIDNKGEAGESSISIVARCGGIPIITTANTEFDTLQKKMKIDFLTIDGKSVEPWHSYDEEYPINVSIGGIEGALFFDTDEYSYFFSRDVVGKKQSIPAGTQIIPYDAVGKDDVVVIWMGQNGGYDTFEELIEQQKSLIPEDKLKEGMYLILGLTSGTQQERASLEAALENEYGKNFINLRQELSGERVKEFVSEISKEDEELMKTGHVPQCLRAPEDMVHLNEYGYEMVAQIVFERMLELDFFRDINIK
ncbi:MAG: hypothetical protein ACI4GD_00390 [Lachnospiraceae bacterium]